MHTKQISKNIKLLAAMLLVGTVSYAQSIAPQSINSSGAKMSQSNGSLSFTVGELVVITQTDNQGNTLGSGFTSSSTITTSSIQATDPSVLDVSVFPNPTSELLNIRINHAALEQVFVSITDLQGKEVYSGKYAGIANTIGVNTAGYAPGDYVLSLKNNNNELLGNYKIIKH